MKILVAVLLCLSIASPLLAQDEKEALEELIKTSMTKEEEEDPSMRMEHVAETAKTLGFQHGFRFQYEKYLSVCRKHTEALNAVFDFQKMLINGRVLPPVVRWSGRAVQIQGTDAVSEIEAQYRIMQPARIVMQAPTWETYLMADTTVLKPTKMSKPKSQAEKAVWKKMVTLGWKQGVEHAKNHFDLSFDSMLADYRGIIRFSMLAKKGLVSVPVLSTGNVGVQIGENVLNMGQTVFRITVPAAFQLVEQGHVSVSR
ncbi:MAG: type IV secretory system conjugative DNA transfer family protein [Desulfovibrio sp.]|nr:type IV secretory system conjugative DNA transfer family protein [Desulfovibrio sp.]